MSTQPAASPIPTLRWRPIPQFLHLYSVEMMSFTFNTAPAIVFRAGASAEIASLSPVAGAKSCLVGGAEKRAVSSPIILLDTAVLDPKLTLSLPAAATGMDAMVHAIEAYTSANANNCVPRLVARGRQRHSRDGLCRRAGRPSQAARACSRKVWAVFG